MIYYLVSRVLVSSALLCLDIARDRGPGGDSSGPTGIIVTCQPRQIKTQSIFSPVHIHATSRYRDLLRWCPRSVGVNKNIGLVCVT